MYSRSLILKCAVIGICIIHQICQSVSLPQRNNTPQRNTPQRNTPQRNTQQKDSNEDEEPNQSVSGPQGMLDLIPDDSDEEEETTTKKPKTSTPKAVRSQEDPNGLLDRPTRRPKQGARIVWQPLWQVAMNAAAKGITSAIVPIMKNEQPTGVQYGSVPLPPPPDDEELDEDSESTIKVSSKNSSKTTANPLSALSNLLNPVRSIFG